MFVADVFAFPLEDNLVMARRGDRRLFVLNPTGRLIWELSVLGLDVDEIVWHIADDCDVPSETIRADVEAALAEWGAAGLLESDALRPTSTVDEGRVRCPEIAPAGEWPFVRAYRLWGATFTLRVADQTMADLLCPLMAHLEAETETVPQVTIDVWRSEGRYAIACDGAVTGRERSAGDALTGVLETIVRRAAPWLDPVAVLHASAVSDGESVAVLAAPARHGKSTLTAALAHAGLVYFSDDSVPLVAGSCEGAPLLDAVAMPLAVCLKEGSWPVLASRYAELESLPIYHRFGRDVRYLIPSKFEGSAARRAPVKRLLFPRYEQGRGATLSPLSPTEALRRLIAAEAWVSFEPDKLEVLVDWLAHTPAYTLEYGSLDEAVPLVEGSLRSGAIAAG